MAEVAGAAGTGDGRRGVSAGDAPGGGGSTPSRVVPGAGDCLCGGRRPASGAAGARAVGAAVAVSSMPGPGAPAGAELGGALCGSAEAWSARLAMAAGAGPFLPLHQTAVAAA